MGGVGDTKKKGIASIEFLRGVYTVNIQEFEAKNDDDDKNIIKGAKTWSNVKGEREKNKRSTVVVFLIVNSFQQSMCGGWKTGVGIYMKDNKEKQQRERERGTISLIWEEDNHHHHHKTI